ncbi:MAG: 30S ribosomal protein S12 methylthiotransferase RimO [Nitrospirae bacterium]|nr:30S ribosomal protein S12 methylthiotransferase RimO [Nitrospirota bacterium]
MANKFSLVSLGCPKNLVDSDNLTEKLTNSGLSYLDNPENTDILLINTCGFIEDAKKESIAEILKLTELKKGSKHLIVFGCLAKRYRDELLKEIPEIDAIFGVGEDERIVEYCKRIKGSRGLSSNPRTLESYQSFASSSYAYLKIAEGCSRKCTYCVIPSIRGEYKSITPDEILKKAEGYINTEIKELILIAQDTASYGKDLKGYDIAALLKDLCSISGDFRIRLLYAYPASIKDPLLNVIAEEEKICKYLDIPFQHSEDRILKLMKRGGSRKGYLNLIRKIRHAIPDIALRTTFIVGFPSETEEEFNSLIKFMEEAEFDRLGAFKYSKEEGTPAAKLKGHLTDAIKNRRFDTIMRRQADISLKKNKTLIGKRFKAVIDETGEGIAVGRLYSHAPEIDGVVIMESSKLKIKSSKLKNSKLQTLNCKLKARDFVTVEITDVYDYDLKGKIIK